MPIADEPVPALALRDWLRRYRASLLTVVVSAGGAWAFVVWSTANMDSDLVRAMMPMTRVWSPREMLLVWLMWAVMMAAMMLPSALPMVMVHRRISQGRETAADTLNACFVAAYLVAWFAFSVAAAASQWAFQALGVLSEMLTVGDGRLGAALLIGAGLYQFTPFKDRCLAKCRTPFGFLVTEWRPGARGAFVMGLKHGAYCVGCCWALMAALFVFGVMTLWAVVVLAGAAAGEKLLPWPGALKPAIGFACLSWGLWLLAAL